MNPHNATRLAGHFQQIAEILIEEIADSVAQRIAAATPLQPAPEPFIGKEEAATFLDMSVSTLERRMGGKYAPPRYMDGGKAAFLRSELREWRKKWRVGEP